MNPFWTYAVLRTVMRKRRAQPYSPYVLAKHYRKLQLLIRDSVKNFLLIGAGIFSAAFGLEGFLLPNHFIDGGATGIALLLTHVSGWPFPLFLMVINLPFIWLANRVVSQAFALRTVATIAVLAAVVSLVPFPEVTHDPLLVAIFGGFFLGAGIGLAIRGSAVLDGTEVLAIFVSRKVGASIGDIITGINIVIFGVAASVLSVEAAMYSLIAYLAASKTADFLVEGIEEYTGITIISPHHAEIRQMIVRDLERGVTIYTGKSGYYPQHDVPVEILYTVITRLEISRFKAAMEKIDPHAFVVMSSVKDTRGGVIKRRPLHD